MLDPLLTLLGDPALLGNLLLGLVIGLVFGLMPGLNGRLGLVLMLPFVIGLDPWVGMVLLVAMHSVVHTSSAIPAILLGVPTSSSEAATVIDGYPMVRKGEAAAAIGATFAASAMGGVIGALALLAFLPLARPLIAYLGSAEVAMLGFIGRLVECAGPFHAAAEGQAVVIDRIAAIQEKPRRGQRAKRIAGLQIAKRG